MTFLPKRPGTLAITIASVSLLASVTAHAEAGKWSDEPVRIVVTFSPGGTSDLVARVIAKYLDSEYGQKAVVDNRPGGGGTVAADYTARQAPDGTTLILSNNAPFTIAPTQFESLPYEPLESFAHIAYIGASSPGLFVQPDSGITDLSTFIEKSNADGITYGSSGVGSITHIVGEAVNTKMEIDTLHVPYKGSAPAIQDFRAGVLDAFYDMLAQNSDMIEDGEATAIALAAPQRLPRHPDVPTFLELGYDVVVENWVGLSAPAGMDESLQQTILDTVQTVVAMPEVQSQLDGWGITHTPMTSGEFTEFVGNTIDVWQPLIIEAGIQGK